jgi:iron complex outermembrane receptor protein
VGDGKLGFNLSGNYVIENARDGAVKKLLLKLQDNL